MKKELLTLLAAGLVMTAQAQQNPQIACRWSALLDGTTTAGDQSTEVCLDKSGNIYWLGTYGTNPANHDITFAGEYLFTGDISDADNSQNNNFTLLKTDADGNKLWAVYSTAGDFENNAGGCAATSDGGIVAVMKLRHSKYGTDTPPSLTDASGARTTIDWTCEDRYYRLLAIKISGAGKIEWTRTIDFSTEPGPGASGNYSKFWSNCFNLPGSCAVDDNDNIYIPLNYRNPLTVARADGSKVTLTPRNNKTWSGDSQSAAGDFLLLSLDAEGYYRKSLELEGTAAAAYCQKLVWNDGRLYAQGYISGDGSDMKAGAFTLSPNSVMSPLFLCTDSDLDVKWAKCYKGENVGGRHGFQNVGITVADKNMWVCGQYNLKLTDPDNSANVLTSTQGSIREGFILKLDAETGRWIAARNSRDDNWNHPSALAKTGLTGYFKVLAEPACKKIYVFGYVMNQTIGVFLREYDAATLTADLENGQNNIVTGGGVPTCQVIAFDTDNRFVYLTARGNKAFTPYGGSATAAPSAWGVMLGKFSMPGRETGAIDSVEAENSDGPAVYYNLQGIRVENPGHGIFIRRQGTRATKVIL